MKERVSVAVVGAGAAGLCALRHLALPGVSSVNLTATCFEQSPRVGGTWYYTEDIGTDKYGLPVHSSMYKHLRTNLPVECMAFPDYPFPKQQPSFVEHEVVLKYLEDYAHNFNLTKYIKFLTKVKKIRPVSDEGSKFKVNWEVTTCSVANPGVEQTQTFNAVLLCNGHYAKPLVPDIPGVNSFPGQVTHSHDYRRTDGCDGKVVVILGAASSGIDISLEMSAVAKQVYLSHNKPTLTTKLPDNLHQKPGIKRVDNSMIEFLDGSSVEADVLMFCTGYHYDYHFLDKDCGIVVHEERVTPLYKHLISSKYPSLGIVGICKQIVPFPMFDVQVRFFRSVLDGTCVLPSEADMNADTEQDFQLRLTSGLPQRHAHLMGDRQFEYNDQLARMANTQPLSGHYKQLYLATHLLRLDNVMEYKNRNFILDPTEVRVVK
ncbi:uncharacterized protein LOC131947629 [Physella acuta]|uniref:uncharacterized protein LOC131947629 n=1 Tax=Physella acuta TaxID=109671 RepID=UPI0027DE0612|nr:uncharacterized protein LOC131947629 [Physella acuta]